MTSPRHLWSGDWRRDSDAAARELAERRAHPVAGEGAPEVPAQTVEPSRPAREPLLERATAALQRGVESSKAIPAPTPRRRRVVLLIALGALVVAGAAYGLAQLGGSGGSAALGPRTGRPWLGATLSQPAGGGVIVGSVVPGGPSERAGIQPGDVIMAVGRHSVSSPGDLQSRIANLRVGEYVPLTVLRGASSYTTLVRLAGAPAGTP